MDESNFNHYSSNCCDRPKSHVNFAFNPLTLPQFYHRSFPRNADNGICDGMNDCHLTETCVNYANYVNFRPNFAELSVLNPYVLPRLPNELQTSSDALMKDTLYQEQSALHNQKYFSNVHCVTPPKDHVHPQQQLLQGGFSRLAELNYKPSLHHEAPLIELSVDCTTSMNEHEERVKTSIKFQDRNKKLDFKVNFRDENRKLNGCFYRDNSKSPNDAASSLAAPPPKKKWIRHYMTGKKGEVVAGKIKGGGVKAIQQLIYEPEAVQQLKIL